MKLATLHYEGFPLSIYGSYREEQVPKTDAEFYRAAYIEDLDIRLDGQSIMKLLDSRIISRIENYVLDGTPIK